MNAVDLDAQARIDTLEFLDAQEELGVRSMMSGDVIMDQPGAGMSKTSVLKFSVAF